MRSSKFRELPAYSAMWLIVASPPIKFRAKFQELYLASLGHAMWFILAYLPSNSEKNFGNFASLRSAMWFILASISGQIKSEI